MKKNMKILVGLFSIMLCLFISGCGNRGTDTKEASGFTDFENIEKEYLETLQELNWPENMELPTALEGETADQFQIGYGVTRASMLWEYAWEKEWLETYTSDTERAERALKELEKAPEMLYMSPQKCDDATREYFKENLEKAKLGDPSGFEENIRLNAPE